MTRSNARPKSASKRSSTAGNDALEPVRVTGIDRYGLDSALDSAAKSADKEAAHTVSVGRDPAQATKKEAVVAKVGDTLTVVGWSPSGQTGEPFEVCARKPEGHCVARKANLKGAVQVLGTWKLARRDVADGFLRLVARVGGRNRADDGVRIT
jgi:hypothetical protein